MIWDGLLAVTYTSLLKNGKPVFQTSLQNANSYEISDCRSRALLTLTDQAIIINDGTRKLCYTTKSEGSTIALLKPLRDLPSRVR